MHNFNSNWDGIVRQNKQEPLNEAGTFATKRFNQDGQTMDILGQIDRVLIDGKVVEMILDELRPILKTLHGLALASRDRNVTLKPEQDSKIEKVLAKIGSKREVNLNPIINTTIKQINYLRRGLGSKLVD